ncbi:2OG-Fe(II) oxygenase family protein [Sphingobium sp.]|uniref:2OG-Fe(II) oxygenase family protein n=1 Tax=Sphingobium sp. TaxID=1912891 RepID=UPI002B565B4E|nr:putative 2OG-Fe(II) oxygenase [Sphingobium sp.]HUD93322.1 putative 2OG-Fe(II) oxygenase [Sphingobium sp.]
MEYRRSLADLAAAQPASPSSPDAAHCLRSIESAIFEELRTGAGDDLSSSLEQSCLLWPDHARLFWLRALVLREMQAHEAALIAAEHAASLAKDDPPTQALLAQLRYETGRSAAAQFAVARVLAPADMALVRGHAGALAAEGDVDAALALMTAMLEEQPDWVEGHTYCATLRCLTGANGRADDGFADALRIEPRNLALHLGRFHWLAKAKQWDDARTVLSEATRACGESVALKVARLYLEAESGAAADRPDLFDKLAERPDAGLALARVRHALRCGVPDRAVEIAMAQLGSPSASLFWPYLSIGWRLLGDDRAAWLDRPDQLIRAADIGLHAQELSDLAELLRALHTATAPYPDQSVRGGSQTDRPLLFRHEPIMQRTRAAIEAAVRDYIDRLPPHEPGHPLLGTPRGVVRFAGSWSVRLSAEGFHAAHTHPVGWISSALHIALPDSSVMGDTPSGWLRFGTPPPELGLDLKPYRQIEPKVGRLVLFPSTLWHGTVPFADGERLSIAFDISPPRR